MRLYIYENNFNSIVAAKMFRVDKYSYRTSSVVAADVTYDHIKKLWQDFPNNTLFLCRNYPELLQIFESFKVFESMGAVFMISSQENAMFMYKLPSAPVDHVIVKGDALKIKIEAALTRNNVFSDVCMVWVYTY
tara:strand:- start:56 stop:457 length:402 start_codon:yes stop_codon:yes gene_type:complete